jgi:hypothetical protein
MYTKPVPVLNKKMYWYGTLSVRTGTGQLITGTLPVALNSGPVSKKYAADCAHDEQGHAAALLLSGNALVTSCCRIKQLIHITRAKGATAALVGKRPMRCCWRFVTFSFGRC